jgi:hypothetical protein
MSFSVKKTTTKTSRLQRIRFIIECNAKVTMFWQSLMVLLESHPSWLNFRDKPPTLPFCPLNLPFSSALPLIPPSTVLDSTQVGLKSTHKT